MTNEQLTALYQFGGSIGVLLAGILLSVPWLIKKVKEVTGGPGDAPKAQATGDGLREAIEDNTEALNELRGKVEVLTMELIRSVRR